jgi:dihydroorotase
MKILLKNGNLIDPSSNENSGKSLLIEDGKVVGRLSQGEADPEGASVIDATGLIVAPGFIDLHVHLREPGQEHKETIASGAECAAASGFTSICCMPNTNPVNDNAAITRFIIEQSARTGFANVFPIGAVTKGSNGAELAEMGEMKTAGIVAVSDDGRPLPSAGIMRRAMEYARDFDLTVVDHCEDKSLTSGGVMHEGRMSLLLGMQGMPALAEDVDAIRDCQLAQMTGARVHIAHVSTSGAIEAVRRAKAAGANVTCEVTPHHFSLTDDAVDGYDTNTKMAPPLRSQAHLDAVLAGIKDGTIDAIATDHAPHHSDEKSLEYDRAPFGITGLETAVGLAFLKLVHTGLISLPRLIELLSFNPAKIFGLENRGTLAAGSTADITLLDPTLNWKFNVAESKSKSRNSPFDGYEFTGGVVATIVDGKIVYQRKQL